mgnify:FL=1|jgi:rRNA processing protein Krr1/Pno1|tara:strand:+ start:1339 stop:1548 length:210 start_codon:yes stop_codon:yes gene_type:complete
MADEKAAKKTRTVKPIYIVMQVTDEGGNPMSVTKEQINILGGFKDAEKVLDAIESGDHPGAVYKKVQMG